MNELQYQVATWIPFDDVRMRATELDNGTVAIEIWRKVHHNDGDMYLYTGARTLEWIGQAS
jgi:hypothetical protein